MRGWSWRVLCGADKLEVRSPGRFEELAAEADTPQNAIMTDYLDIIERDLDRTFPHNERFSQVGGEGQLELRKVLRALAMANKELGYCQVCWWGWHTCTQTRTHKQRHTHTHARKQTHARARTHTHTHTHTRARAHTHTAARCAPPCRFICDFATVPSLALSHVRAYRLAGNGHDCRHADDADADRTGFLVHGCDARPGSRGEHEPAPRGPPAPLPLPVVASLHNAHSAASSLHARACTRVRPHLRPRSTCTGFLMLVSGRSRFVGWCFTG
jgi:hypothetical protein